MLLREYFDVIIAEDAVFRDGLQCAKSRIEGITTIGVLLKRKGKIVSNRTDDERAEWIDSNESPEAIVQYNGNPYLPSFIQRSAAQMIANLFYIEVKNQPSRFSFPQNLFASMRCRLPPGPALLDLISTLNTEVQIQSS
ncbi:hypothetical protein B0T21DRAFT_344853 [Apiosordaria backusii]|uniref:Uncharacterized protein n=1 Tax=Apiosordaria backusii TaxID=314023 RepID=A0AA40K3P2_9PEZI|nr:hypothetical protein B0T21DRAFT_344853 [Apiosordaria backusii]